MDENQDSPSAATAHWLPSHVRISVHQAKDLHLKNKSGSSEVYVRIESDQATYLSKAVPKQTAPSWNEDFIIPLMSLVTTLHIQVRQKGRFGDKYLGYFPISPDNFSVCPKTVTNWYKLGPKPGKSGSKLRGDLKISFQFLSEWSDPLGQGLVQGMQQGLLQRSSSDRKIWNGNGIGSDTGSLITENQPVQSKGRKELLSTLRRSFRRKNKPSSGSLKSDDEFLFSSGDFSPVPHHAPKRSNTINMMTRPPGGISNARPVSLGQFTDSDGSLNSGSPMLSRMKSRGSDPSILELNSPVKGGGVAIGGGEKDAGSPLSSSASESKLPTEQQFQYFISKKTPYKPAKPMDTVSTTSSSSDITAGKVSPSKDGSSELLHEATPTTGSGSSNPSHMDSSQPVPFTYRSRATKSFRENGKSPHKNSDSKFVDRNVEDQSNGSSKPSSEPSDNSSTAQSSSNGRTSSPRKDIAGEKAETASPKSPSPVKSPSSKSHPYSRKIDIAPRKPSPSVERARPRILSYENSKDDSSPFSTTSSSSPKSRNSAAQLKRRSTISSPANRSRLLPATPVRRKPQATTKTNSKSPPSRSAGNSCRNSLCLVEDPLEASEMPNPGKVESKLTSSTQDVTASRKEGRGSGRATPVGVSSGARQSSTPTGATSPDNGKSERPVTPRSKHTVQYSGMEPVSLLPPSLSDYTTRSYTLPVRGKHSKRTSESKSTDNPPPSLEKPDPSSASTTIKPQSAPPSQGLPSKNIPTNTKFVPRESLMNLFPSPTSPLLSQTEVSQKEETDGSRSEFLPPNSPVSSDGGQEPTPVRTAGGGCVSTPPTAGVALKKEISRSSDSIPVGERAAKGKSPSDIASSARLRKPAGGMRKAMSMYQESRKQHHLAAKGRKGSSSSANADGGTGFPVDVGSSGGDSDRLLLIDTTTGSSSHSGSSAREYRSAENSPLPDHPRENAGSFGSVFISSLKRTSSLLFAGASRHKTQVAPDNGKDPAADTTQLNSFHDDMLTISPPDKESQKSSAPAILMRTLNPDKSGIEKDQSSGSGRGTNNLVESGASTHSNGDSSSSVMTLTNSDSRVVVDQSADHQRHSPNPAGAAASPCMREAGPEVGVSSAAHVRHTTSSSVESDGFHSMSSEEVGSEELALLSKEELIKEVIQGKRKLREKDDELKEAQEQLSELKAYLDTILVRVMETNPAILSSRH